MECRFVLISTGLLCEKTDMEIGNSNDKEEIEEDWEYLKQNIVPQLKDKIDVGKFVRNVVNEMVDR